MLCLSRPDSRDHLQNVWKVARKVEVTGINTSNLQVYAWTDDGGHLMLRPDQVVIEPRSGRVLWVRAYMPLRENKDYSGEVYIFQVPGNAQLCPLITPANNGWSITSTE